MGPSPKSDKTGLTASGTTVVTGVESASALLDALTDEFSRRIVGSTVSLGKSIEEIASEQLIPVSTCYRKVKQLVNQGVMLVERKAAPGGGKGHAVYRSTFSGLRVEMRDGDVFVHVTVNPNFADRTKR